MIYEYICWFFFYSIIGWIYESILCSVIGKKWVNRGFLNGPYCPIYGFGAILNILILDETMNIAILFYLGMVTACSLEYFTSWLLEKLFQTRWWDYTEQKYNLNGRICLAGGIVFGIFSVLLVRVIQPEVINLTNALSDTMISAITLSILVLFVLDCSVTIINVLGFNKKLKLAEIRLQITEIRFQIAEIKLLMSKLNLQERRLLRAFPKLKSMLYDDALQLIKDVFKNTIRKN